MIFININNLKEGMIIKNYKELCSMLDIPISSSNSKKAQLKELNRYCEYHKEGNKFIIDTIYDIPLEKEDKRQYAIHSKYKKEFNIDHKLKYHKGIYYIIDKYMNLYIGSTISSFRKRFNSHITRKYKNSNNRLKTYDLLHNNNGTFNILYDMNNIEDKELIRMVEQEYIKYFKDNYKYNVINVFNTTSINTKGYKNIRLIKKKYKTVKILEDDYIKALDILKQNNINIK